MQSFNIFRLLGKYWAIITVVTLVAFAASLIAYNNAPLGSQGLLSVTAQVSRNYPSTSQLILQPSTSADVQLAVNTSSAWAVDPATVKEVLDKAGIDTNDASIASLGKTFKVVEPAVGSSTYQIEYVGENDDEVSKVLVSLKDRLQETATTYNSAERNELDINLQFTSPVIVPAKDAFPLTPVAGILGGFAFAVLIVSIMDRKDEKHAGRS